MTKKASVAVLLGAASIVVISVFAFAATQRIDLIPCPINYSDLDNPPPGRAFVIYNNPAGSDHNLTVTVSLKGVEPDVAYDLYLFVDGVWYDGKPAGTLTTNRQGNGTFHMNGLLPPGPHVLSFDVTLAGSTSDIYESPGIHEVEGVLMTFR
jgi:hypothetical protein